MLAVVFDFIASADFDLSILPVWNCLVL